MRLFRKYARTSYCNSTDLSKKVGVDELVYVHQCRPSKYQEFVTFMTNNYCAHQQIYVEAVD